MYLCSVVTYLALRKLQRLNVPSEVNNFFMWVISALTFILIAVMKWEYPNLELKYIGFLFLTAFFLSYIGQVFSLEAIRKAPNPGYSLMIQKSYAIFTAVAAVFLFDSELTPKNIVAIVIVILFLVLIVRSDAKVKVKDNTVGWIRDSFLAFFSFGINALAAKWLLDQGVDPFIRGFYVMIFLSIFFTLDLIRKNKTNKSLRNHFRSARYYPWFIIMGVTTGLFNLTMQYAYNYTPNVGYVNIMNTASIAAITLLSAYFFKERLHLWKLIGVAGCNRGSYIVSSLSYL